MSAVHLGFKEERPEIFSGLLLLFLGRTPLACEHSRGVRTLLVNLVHPGGLEPPAF